jgi:hypothetical protein
MLNRFIVAALICMWLPLSIHAQKIEAPTFQTDSIEMDSTGKKWSGLGGIGLDATTITLINPRLSDGDSRISMGGLLNYNVNFQNKKFVFTHRGSLQLSTTKEGDDDWAKAADALLLNTQIGFGVGKNWYLAAMLDIQTQLINTYDGKYINGNNGKRSLTSRFFSPATIKIAPGMLWKPKPYFSLLFSVLSNKNIIVSDPVLAAIQADSTENTTAFGSDVGESLSAQLGGEIRADLNIKFADDKIALNSVFDVYSNYLRNPEKVSIEWLTGLDVTITKSLSLSMRSDWFFDPNVFVKLRGNINNLGKNVSIRNMILLKYNKIF